MSRTKLHKVNDIKKEPGIPEMMNKQMMYMMPIITVVISASLPGGLALYWFVMTLFSVFEQYIANKSLDKENANVVPEVIDIK
jgi:membrane protein insertase Oxa1/YidC/SpoIIIJ